jgi:hypothetical protein
LSEALLKEKIDNNNVDDNADDDDDNLMTRVERWQKDVEKVSFVVGLVLDKVECNYQY